jgi:hypothetical protein
MADEVEGSRKLTTGRRTTVAHPSPLHEIWADYPDLTPAQRQYLVNKASCGTNKVACDRTGIALQTPYRWRWASPSFKAASDRLAELSLEIADWQLASGMPSAVDTIEHVMIHDEKGDTRLKAARTVLEATGRLGRGRGDITIRITPSMKHVRMLLGMELQQSDDQAT